MLGSLVTPTVRVLPFMLWVMVSFWGADGEAAAAVGVTVDGVARLLQVMVRLMVQLVREGAATGRETLVPQVGQVG